MIYTALYNEDVKNVATQKLPWEELEKKKIIISGACGLIASFVIDVLMYKNDHDKLSCEVYAMGRNIEKAKKRFNLYWYSELFHFVSQDVNNPVILDCIDKIDFVVHMASNTHPIAYATDPIGTITTNIIGTNNMLEFACAHKATRFAFASSNEVYGENRGDVELFSESYCGYLDSNTLRAGYPESKRCGEALCQAYLRQKKLDIVIPRFTRTYGPTMQISDTKAVSQFIMKGVKSQDIILKSKGDQYYSYTYVADAASGFLFILLCGKNGEAYNIADQKSDIRLKEIAKKIAEIAHTKVVFQIPDEVEKVGYSTATKARLDGQKLEKLGWCAKYTIDEGLIHTISILKENLQIS